MHIWPNTARHLPNRKGYTPIQPDYLIVQGRINYIRTSHRIPFIHSRNIDIVLKYNDNTFYEMHSVLEFLFIQ